MSFLSNISLVILLSLTVISCKSSKNANNSESVTLKLNIMFTSAYCGGAYPPDELLKQLKQPKPLVKKEIFYLLKGDSLENAKKILTDENGIAEINLNPGEYQLFFPEKISSTPSKPLYKRVCETWKNTPNGTFTITKDDRNIITTVAKTCNGCYDPAV